MESTRLKTLIIGLDVNIREAIKQMDAAGEGIILVVDQSGVLKGVVTDGDFRRAILSGVNLGKNVTKIMSRNFKFVNEKATTKAIIGYFKNGEIRHLPVCRGGKLIDLIIEDEFLLKGKSEKKSKRRSKLKINNPVVIMAGGKGTRLDPFTRILPKPLIPINDKAIIEVIMENFAAYGMKKFIVSLNYKSKLIKAYFQEKGLAYQLDYIEEEKPLGTAGALRKLISKVKKDLFVSNCDIIIKANYVDVLQFHKKGNYEITIVGTLQHHVLPYGVCEINSGGELKVIKEKPQYDFIVNTGMYILKPNALKSIPKNKFYNMTDLITDLKKKGKRVGVFPISDKAWIDTGEWDKYRESIRSLGTID